MVDNSKRKLGVGSGIAVAVVSVVTFLVHEAGGVLHEAGSEAGHGVPEIHAPRDVPPVHLPDVQAGDVNLSPQDGKSIEAAAKQGAATFKALRNGDEYDKIAVAAGCSVFNAGLSYSDTYDDTKSKVYAYVPPDFQPDGPLNFLVAKPVGRVVNALTAAQLLPGNSKYYYFEYCGPKPPS